MRRWLHLLPNLISSIRILLILPLAVAIAHRRFTLTLSLFAIAAASDAVDGFLAKRFGWQTEIGGMLDPIADKLLLASVFVMLSLLGAVPPWLTMAVIARDCVIVLGAVSYRILLGPVAARPTTISKLNTLCQVVYIVVVIGARVFAWPNAWQVALGALVFVTVCVSGLHYVLVYGRQAAAEARARQRLARSGGSNPA